jgi:hypothetical protein
VSTTTARWTFITVYPPFVSSAPVRPMACLSGGSWRRGKHAELTNWCSAAAGALVAGPSSLPDQAGVDAIGQLCGSFC